jgi:hypothetical protein
MVPAFNFLLVVVKKTGNDSNEADTSDGFGDGETCGTKI